MSDEIKQEEAGVKEEEKTYEDSFAEFAAKGEEDDRIEIEHEPEELKQDDEELKQDDPEPEAKKKETAEPEPDEKAESTTDDPWKDVPDEIKNSFSEMERKQAELVHKLNSDKGRVGALQRKINALEKANIAPTQKQKEENNKQWESLKEDYPEIAQAIEAKFADHASVINGELNSRINTAIQPIYRAEADRSVKTELEKLSAPKEQGGFGHSDWHETRHSPEYNNWIAQQPVQVQTMMTSESAQDAAYLLDLFKMQTGFKQPQSAVDVETKSDTAVGMVDKIQERRKKQLSDSANVTTRRESSQRGTPADDFDSAFSMYAKRKEKQFNSR